MPVTIRPALGRGLAVATIVICALAVLGMLAAGDAVDPRLALGPVLAAYLAWLTLWAPSVLLDEDAVELRNVLHTVTIPWGEIAEIDTRFGLRIAADTRVHSAWAAPSPGRHAYLRIGKADLRDLPADTYTGGAARAADAVGTDSGDAAVIMRRRLAQPDLPRGAVTRRPHLVRIATLAALLVALIAALVLG